MPRSRRRLPEGVSHFALAKINVAIPDIRPMMLPLPGLAGDDYAHRLAMQSIYWLIALVTRRDERCTLATLELASLAG